MDLEEPITSTWYYYYGKDVIKIPKYWQGYLRGLYVSKYGGWYRINLGNTEYDGRVWWDYKALEKAAGDDINLHPDSPLTAKEIRKLGA